MVKVINENIELMSENANKHLLKALYRKLDTEIDTIHTTLERQNFFHTHITIIAVIVADDNRLGF